jgi:hypothetical protein
LHPKGPHGYGFIVGDYTSNISIIGNLIAHNYQRNPLLKFGSSAIVANNLIYNTGELATHADARYRLKASIVGNVYIKGPDSSGVNPIYLYNSDSTASVYVSDNDAVGAASNPWSIVSIKPSDVIFHASKPPVWDTGLVVRSSGEVKSWVLSNTGARPADRDSVDARIVSGVKNGTGRIINCVANDGSARCRKNAGGWPVLAQNYRALVLPASPNGDDDKDGYTNLEEWLHSYSAEVEGRAVSSKVPNPPVQLRVE